MLRSLRFRFILSTVVIVVVAVGTVGFISTRVSNEEFNRYVSSTQNADLSQFADILQQYYAAHRWNDAESVLKRISTVAGKRFILIDTQGQVIAAWPGDLIRRSVRLLPNHGLSYEIEQRNGGEVMVSEVELLGLPYSFLVDQNKNRIGTLYGMELQLFSEETEQFAFSIKRRVLAVVLIAALFSCLLAFVVTTRLLGPIEKLTQAARKMAKGDFQQRVAVDAKDETGELTRAFNAMAESLQRIEQLRRNMVSDIAHELRTPLTNIRGQLETLQDGLAKADASMIDSLHEEAMLLNFMIDDLQDLALSDAGRLRLSFQPVNLTEEIESTIRALVSYTLKKQIDLMFAPGTDLPVVQADRVRIRQTLRNVLNNAVAHTPFGGRITISSCAKPQHLEISVTDTGEGIPSEDLPFIFERFFRSDRSRTRKTGGAGLGLSIVQQLIHAHGGTVHAQSEFGKGTTVTFTLPLNSVTS
jgi:signal transduction histidine kinase